MSEFTSNISEQFEETYRFVNTPSAWIPRWMDSAVETNNPGNPQNKPTNLSSIYHTCITKTQEDVKLVDVSTKFFHSLEVTRNCFLVTSDVSYEQLSLNLGQITSGHVFGEVRQVKTFSDLLKINHEPVFCVHENKVIAKNLDLIEYSITTNSSGAFNFSSIFTENPPIKDTIVAYSNVFGEVFTISPEKFVLNNNSILFKYPGNYRIRYSCINFSALLNADSKVSVNNRISKVTSIDNKNILDTTSSLFNITRFSGEDNLSLRKRYQTSAFSIKPEQHISSALGRSVPISWMSTDSLTINATGWSQPNLVSLNKYGTFTEKASLIGSNFVLTKKPYGGVKILINGTVLDPINYSVSGNLIQPLNAELFTGVGNQINVEYLTENFKVETTVNGLTIVNNNLTPTLFYGIVPTSVELIKKEVKLEKFNWGSIKFPSKTTSIFD
jgi:hypothetical protein